MEAVTRGRADSRLACTAQRGGEQAPRDEQQDDHSEKQRDQDDSCQQRDAAQRMVHNPDADLLGL